MRIVQPPQSDKIQYIESPELVARLVELQKQVDQLRLSKPQPVVREVIKEVKVVSKEAEAELARLKDIVKRYENQRLSVPKTVEKIVSKETLKEVVKNVIPKKAYIYAAISSGTLFAIGVLIGKYILK